LKTGKPIIGLAGGIGSGKSATAAILRDLGAGIVSSDQLNHEVLNTPAVLDRLREWWGEKVLGPDGRADRDAIRGIVTQDGQARRRLEDLVHPIVTGREEQLIADYLTDPDVSAIVWDCPLLYEVGSARKCDSVIFVDADPKLRRARVFRERGWTAEDLERFENSQLSLETKRKSADYTIANNSDITDLRREVVDIFSKILAGK